jgi:hypothetical protein
MNVQTRDYDEEPIVIKDYGAYFQASFIMFLVLLVMISWVNDFQNARFESISVYSFEFIRLAISVIFCLWFFYYMFKISSKFKSTPSMFYFYKDKIHYIRYMYDGSSHKDDITSPLNIEEVSFCIVPELTFRYGRLHYLTSWQLYRKSSIGVHVGKSVLYLRFLLNYIFFVFPYKFYRLYKDNEPYSLLAKNLFIKFDNRNYFLVNIYSEDDLSLLLEYFKLNNITVKYNTIFIPQAQNDGPFQDENEIWIDELNINKGQQ